MCQFGHISFISPSDGFFLSFFFIGPSPFLGGYFGAVCANRGSLLLLFLKLGKNATKYGKIKAGIEVKYSFNLFNFKVGKT